EEFEKRKAEVDLVYALKKSQWLAIGKSYQYSVLGSEIGESYQTLLINPGLKSTFIRNRLQKDFGEDAIEMGIVPSILTALGVGTGPWGFGTGTSSSRAAGEAWLTDHDPTAPNLTPSAKSKDKEEKKTPSKSTVDEEGINTKMATED
ncbi:MAG: hypothetical protein ACXVA2_25175, partial [Mucilaginibacter sp.]